MEYIRICPMCGSDDLGLPKRIESMPGFSVNERCYCNNCGKESVPLLISKDMDRDEGGNTGFQEIFLIPIDTNNNDHAAISEIRWDQKIRAGRQKEMFASYKQKLLESPNQPSIMVLDINGINDAHTNYRILKEVVKPKYKTYLDPGIHCIEDIFDAFTLDAWKVVCNSVCSKSISLFKEAFEISDHVLPCLYIHEGKVIWKSPKEEKDVLRVIRQLENTGFDEMCIIDADRLGNPVADYSHIRHIADMHSGIIYGGGVDNSCIPLLKESGLTGAVIDVHDIKTN